MKWFFVAALLTILTSSQGILTTLSQSNGGYKYDYAIVPFLVEIFKLVVSGLLLWRECQRSSLTRMTTQWKSAISQEEIVLSAVDGNHFIGCWNNDNSVIIGNTYGKRLWGVFVRVSFFSTYPRVYVGNPISLSISNDRFGVIFNMARLLLDDFTGGFENGPWWQRLLNGYSITTWMVVINLGSTGLLVSWLMKYADNIVKVYSTSMAMLLTTVLSVYLFSYKPTLQLFLGLIICMVSLHMYFAPPNMLLDMPLTEKASPKSLNEVYVERRTDS